MIKNSNLHKAKIAKNDEFYTQLNDVARELKHYKTHFKDKVVLCNCDDPTWSAFWRYFHLNFEHLGLKKLISTHYDKEKPTYKMEYEGGDDNGIEVGTKTPLEGNGDFRNAECIELLKESDIVCTNPPFSLFREYVAQLMEHEKKFLIIGNKNAITYKEFFPLIRDNKVWIGMNNVHEFIQPDETIKKFGNIGWYTNLDHKKRHEDLDLWETYSPEKYPKYDNYDAINVDKVSHIPKDYEPCWYKCHNASNCRYAQTEGLEDKVLCEHACNGEIGVPITYLDKHNPEEMKILANGGSYKGEGSIAEELFVYRERERRSTNESSSAGCRKCNGVMGVPITFLDKYNPELFEIVAFRKGDDGKDLVFTRERERSFNRTFESLYDVDSRDDKERRRQDKRETYLCENNNQTKDIEFFTEYILSHPEITKSALSERERDSRYILADCNKLTEHSCQRLQDQRAQDICQSAYQKETVDLFFPLVVTGRAPGTLNGLINGNETYRRILIRRRNR